VAAATLAVRLAILQYVDHFLALMIAGTNSTLSATAPLLAALLHPHLLVASAADVAVSEAVTTVAVECPALRPATSVVARTTMLAIARLNP
jgi:hypothetical protein